jgi:lipopolysaccharide biosynthesis regulator YciM
MSEKKIIEERHEIAKVIDKKIQYGENEYSCFACGAKIQSDTKVCPNCNTEQKDKESLLKE